VLGACGSAGSTVMSCVPSIAPLSSVVMMLWLPATGTVSVATVLALSMLVMAPTKLTVVFCSTLLHSTKYALRSEHAEPVMCKHALVATSA
jgi:hypothetical protein